MTSEKMNPAQRAAGRARNVISLAAINSESNSAPLNFQDLRVAHLVRRYRLAPAMSRAVASLLFQDSTR
jgi:hypothetical protein